MPGLRVISEKELLTSEKSEKTLRSDNYYLYNGKELDESIGWYFYGFRMYDPAIARFPSLDPKADAFAHVSPYNYAENEPVGSIDLWGLQRYPVNMTNMAANVQEGFRMMFDAAATTLSAMAEVYKVNKTYSSRSKVGNVRKTSGTATKTSLSIGTNFSQIFDNHGDNKVHMPVDGAFVFKKETKTTKFNEVNITTPAADITVSNEKDSNGITENKVELSKGPVSVDVTDNSKEGISTNVTVKAEVEIPTSENTSTTYGAALQVKAKL